MTNSVDKFKGIGVAVVTPFTVDGKVDFPNLEKLVENLITNKVDYLLAVGTTSEYPTMSKSERLDIVRCIASVNAGRVPMLMGLGGPSTQSILSNIKDACKLPIDAILSVTPYYNKPSQLGLIEHYKAVAKSSPLPVILYNVPGRTSCNMLAETTIRIAESNPNVIGIKEASGNVKQILYLLNHKPKDFLVISGDDLITLPLMAAGMDGLISVLANAYPAETANMVHLAMNDQFIKARLYHDKLFDISQACFKEGNPSGIKAILAAQGKIKNVLRLPLVPVSDNLSNEIHKLVQL
jgi:4-hydroxy-tetrahydrodipicolinate synthase